MRDATGGSTNGAPSRGELLSRSCRAAAEADRRGSSAELDLRNCGSSAGPVEHEDVAVRLLLELFHFTGGGGYFLLALEELHLRCRTILVVGNFVLPGGDGGAIQLHVLGEGKCLCLGFRKSAERDGQSRCARTIAGCAS